MDDAIEKNQIYGSIIILTEKKGVCDILCFKVH